MLGTGLAHRTLAFATPFLNAVGHGVLGWLRLKQAMLARHMLQRGTSSGDAALLSGKVLACRYFSEQEMPEALAGPEQAKGDPDVLLSVAEDAL